MNCRGRAVKCPNSSFFPLNRISYNIVRKDFARLQINCDYVGTPRPDYCQISGKLKLLNNMK